jgi:hypothetical protein
MKSRRKITRCRYRAKMGHNLYGKYATWAEAQGRCNRLIASGKGGGKKRCKVVKRPKPCYFRRDDKLIMAVSRKK